MEYSRTTLDSIDSPSDPSEMTTDQLLAAFIEHRDQIAFERLMRRFGPLVFGVCRRVLANHHDAEDVFQATFVLLARKANSIRNGQTLATWLHQVALRAALRVKSTVVARKKKEMRMSDIPEPAALEKDDWAELERLLDRELDSLPEIYRLPILLCDIAGMTHKEAAREFNCSEGTISSRLSRARGLLASRLARQGLVMTSTTLAVLFSQNAVSAAVPGSLLVSTLTAVSVTNTITATATGSVFAKLMAFVKSVGQSFALGKAALAGTASIAIVAAGLAIQTPQREAAPKALAAPFAEIAATYRKNYDAIKSLKFEIRPSEETLIDPEVYYKTFKDIRIQPEAERETWVFDGDKVSLKHWRKGKTWNGVINQVHEQHPEHFPSTEPMPLLPYQEFMEKLPNAPVEIYESIRIFDGHVLLDNNRGVKMNFDGDDLTRRPVHTVYYPSQARRQEFFFDGGNLYLDLMLYGITGAKVDFDYRQRAKFRLPDLLANEKWRVVAEQERLDGADCLVIESQDKNKLWLDRQAGFAVRRWTTGSPITTDREYHDLRQIAGDFWVPQTIVVTWFGNDQLPAEVRGKPVLRFRYDLNSFEFNEPVPEEAFRLPIPPGAIVYNCTVKPTDEAGQPIEVGSYGNEPPFAYYLQPDDPADLPKVLKNAAIEMKSRYPAPGKAIPIETAQGDGSNNQNSLLSTSTQPVSWFVAVNIILLLIGVGYLTYRRVLEFRRTRSASRQ